MTFDKDFTIDGEEVIHAGNDEQFGEWKLLGSITGYNEQETFDVPSDAREMMVRTYMVRQSQAGGKPFVRFNNDSNNNYYFVREDHLGNTTEYTGQNKVALHTHPLSGRTVVHNLRFTRSGDGSGDVVTMAGYGSAGVNEEVVTFAEYDPGTSGGAVIDSITIDNAVYDGGDWSTMEIMYRVPPRRQ